MLSFDRLQLETHNFMSDTFIIFRLNDLEERLKSAQEDLRSLQK